MLDVLRKRKRSWIITLLLGLIIVVFIAFYGGNQFSDPALQDVAAVNGEVITQREFVLHYQRALEKYRELLKGSLTPELEKKFKPKSWFARRAHRKTAGAPGSASSGTGR